ncbi:MAG TPA: hypothetical protein VMD91_13500 [Candidatus Sulfotelmatobacter sp.]|nr:hypothetical protein [Candidatus Sulfotelmatobacter sp.]
MSGLGTETYAERFARIVTHYWRHAAFLDDEQLIRDAGSLTGIPGRLIHGRYDVSSPAETAWRLHRAWPASELQIVADAAHADAALMKHVVAACNRR